MCILWCCKKDQITPNDVFLITYPYLIAHDFTYGSPKALKTSKIKKNYSLFKLQHKIQQSLIKVYAKFQKQN